MAFEPVNALENALMNAAAEVSARPEFYRILALSDVFIPGHTSGNTSGTVTAGETISLQNMEIEGKQYITAFTSKEQLSQSIERETDFVTLKFLDLVGFIGDSEIVLNPGREFGKLLLTWEIAGIRDGSIWKPQEQSTVQRDTQVMIGHPSNPPTKLIENLKKYFLTRPEVEYAFNVHFHNPETHDKAHTLICVTANGNRELISSDIGIIAGGSEVPDPPVDVMFVTKRDGFGKGIYAGYKPFYQKKVGIFGKLFGN